ncbi:ketoacyl-ACP synthase III [Cytophagales bacterium LB-30]|uniref:Ketoacyl-ACP synthase III n=1 Tax=Shiella aurantiaca TaxID=3058365 RepID=A0ABT8FAI3_9BACT|nr:ketoacyl-ACP synthase III [Shiella aurantiaca]MDN4166986.1 ketoacyl-ACP synthase III [Shiella aurantiaca]
MFINRVAHYIPDLVIPNAHFEKLNGLTNDWILERTGISERRRATEGENTNTMALEAVKKGIEAGLPYDISEINLIVGGTYSPYDTVGTLAHVIQAHIQVADIPVVSVSSACSTLLNCMEIVEGYFAMGKADKAIVVVSEHNSLYHNETDPMAGHLWGDGAAAFFISKEKQSETDFNVSQIITGGAATVGKGTEGVMLRPRDGGINMPFGKDVFINACAYMSKVTKDILENNGYSLNDLSYLVPHQANLRISKNITESLGLSENVALSNIEYLGNTGCAGAGIAFSEHQGEYKKGDKIVLVVFGGGYSYGAMLVEV